jgi:hypothetical protein
LLLISAESWQARYEQLRTQVGELCVSSGGQRQRWGLALLVQRGLLAWMRAWPNPEPATPPETAPRAFSPSDNASVPFAIQQQIASVLVNMVLVQVQEVPA